MRLQAQVYRAHNPGWAFVPTSGAGAALHGGRFNPIGRSALYTSLTQQCAWTEAQQGFPFKAQPVTICAYEVDCDGIEDLCDPDTRTRLGVASADLSCPWEDLADQGLLPPSWKLAERLIAAGTSGIVVPSFAPGATPVMRNVVFWDWSDDLPHKVRVVDHFGRLPRNRSSWRTRPSRAVWALIGGEDNRGACGARKARPDFVGVRGEGHRSVGADLRRRLGGSALLRGADTQVVDALVRHPAEVRGVLVDQVPVGDATSDAIRDGLSREGIAIKDGPSGTKWEATAALDVPALLDFD